MDKWLEVYATWPARHQLIFSYVFILLGLVFLILLGLWSVRMMHYLVVLRRGWPPGPDSLPSLLLTPYWGDQPKKTEPDLHNTLQVMLAQLKTPVGPQAPEVAAVSAPLQSSLGCEVSTQPKKPKRAKGKQNKQEPERNGVLIPGHGASP